MSRIAIIGLGAMGSRMAQNLLADGHALTVYNRTPERADALVQAGATRADSAKGAALGAELVISMVTDDDASRAVWLDPERGAVAGLGADAVAVESSTLTPAWVAELDAAVRARGATLLDAPVVGTRPHAEAKQLVYLVGGSEAALAKAKVALEALGGAIHHIGPVGTGMAMKLAVNALFGIQVVAYAELHAALVRSGVDAERARAVLTGLPITSPVLARVAGLMAAGSFSPNFPIDLVAKDFRYAVAAAERVDAQTPTTAAVRDVFQLAQRKGYGQDDISGITQLFRR